MPIDATDPSQQGLKHPSRRTGGRPAGHIDATDPSQQGLKQYFRKRLDEVAQDIDATDPSQQGLKPNVPHIHAPILADRRDRSITTRIETP